ncbi:heterokaryon incompatibility protein [Beauveria bassiana ARSEF 2860]|uniref:Heterokaryon incompatibility protein n=1 Tax=Beauveria bassiana (strain ARSEF 2860) TaxID=655819 RepID=J4KQU5_BEAB2|nr:heterokaryon incompatibility protein [Beauveria bassiana ARSEF 2860]EJP69814.1 heterokaryon incompatibility protein [Beauveria bassiana ARSEF 2860]
MFVYRRLRPDCRDIRLVRFMTTPDALQGNGRLQLQLASVRLNEAPSYCALSYVWGDPTPRFSIILNGQQFEIAETLHFALSQLSHAAPGDVWFWIDAICINQSDLEERSWQVGQMRDIFQRAESVYVSLGDSHDESALFLALSNYLGHDAREAGVLELWASFSHGGHRKLTFPDDPEEHPALLFLSKVLDYEDLRDTRVLNAMACLLDRPIWYRAWVVQEIALAKSGKVLCGEQSIDLDGFHATLTAIYFAKIGGFARRQPQWNDFGLGLNNNRFHIQCLLSRLQLRRGQPFSLLELLLSEMRGADYKRPFYAASDPRDIIFALLGVAADADVLGIRPDYRQPTELVYTEATKAMIKHCPHYRLEYCTFPKDTPHLPSWVPDWERIGRLGVQVPPLSYRDYFHASRGRTQPCTAEASGLTLWRRGIVIDSIAKVFTFDESTIAEQDCRVNGMDLATMLESKTGRPKFLKALLDFIKPYCKDNSSESNLWRVMLSGLMGSEKQTSEFDALAFRAFRQEAVAANSIDEAQLGYILRNSRPYPHELEQDEDIQTLVDDFCDRIVTNVAVGARGRALLVTVHGALGLGPYTVREEDVVTILFGTQVPIVLRPAGATYTYVGDAYIEGSMKGERMAEEFEELDFEIS